MCSLRAGSLGGAAATDTENAGTRMIEQMSIRATWGIDRVLITRTVKVVRGNSRGQNEVAAG
jgi:hypothetical protein